MRLFTKALLVDNGGLEYLVDTRDLAIGRSLFSDDLYESGLFSSSLELAATLLGRDFLEGRTFVDIGANIGTSTIPAVVNYRARKVLCFEPNPDVARLLRCNLLLNNIADCSEVFEIALSDTDGWAQFEVASTNSGDGRVRISSEVSGGVYGEHLRDVRMVRSARLDTILEGNGVDVADIGLVWIDAQGHEARILAGASSVARSRIPVVLEYWPYGLRRAEGLDDLHLLIAANYDKVVDIRRSLTSGVCISAPAGEVASLEANYPGVEFTDLLLL